MFESPAFKRSLDEEIFNRWLADGRGRNLGYHYMLVIWDEFELAFQPVYVTNRHDICRWLSENMRDGSVNFFRVKAA
ncbi:MAG: hypothetical protein ACOYXT_17325 [Bacteroidota bacterium]